MNVAGKIASLVEGAIARTRYIVRGLLPVDIEEEGLSFALRRLAGEIRAVRGVDCLCVCEEPCLVRDNVVATNLYRIVQEALANVAKHSEATRASVSVFRDGERLVIEIRDDGVGGADADGSGLVGLASRVGAVGGTLAIDSAVGGPTLIRAEMPCG